MEAARAAALQSFRDCDDARGDRGPGLTPLSDWLRALLPICRSGCATAKEGPTGRAVT